MAQWGEHSPPTNVAQIRFPDLASCGLSFLLVLVLAPIGQEVFSLRNSVFPSPQKPLMDGGMDG